MKITRVIPFIASGALALGLFGCGKGKPAEPAPPCPSTFKDLAAGDAQKTCTCAANAATGNVWGVDVYTQDSSLCAAAVHAGVIQTAGGEITVKASAGCESYPGSSRNGINTGSWGSFPGSFFFVGKGNGACAPAAAAAAAPPAPAPPPTPPPVATGDACPSRFLDVPNVSDSTELNCSCKPEQVAGSVWGSNIYTRDSSICAAAVHSGALAKTGGTVNVKAAPGCSKYAGTTQNGVTTGKWGAFAGSFYFPAKGKGECPKS